MAATSRDSQRSAAGSLVCRKAPFGSVIRIRPATAARPATCPAGREPGSRRSDGTKPRLTSTVKPASVASGVITQKPPPSTVTACTAVSRSLRKVPSAATCRYSSPSRVRPAQVAGPGAGTGAACTRASTRAIRSRFQARRWTCHEPSPTRAEKARRPDRPSAARLARDGRTGGRWCGVAREPPGPAPAGSTPPRSEVCCTASRSLDHRVCPERRGAVLLQWFGDPLRSMTAPWRAEP